MFLFFCKQKTAYEMRISDCSSDVCSSDLLAFHYVADFDRLVKTVHAALVPGAAFVFSIEHPVLMASRQAGWKQHEDGSPLWPVDHYAVEGEQIGRASCRERVCPYV